MNTDRRPPDPSADPASAGHSRPRGLSSAQLEELSLALVLVISTSLFPRWRVFEQVWVRDVGGIQALPWHWYASLLFLLLGLLLTLPTWRRSGLGFGRIREYRREVSWIMFLSIGTVAAVFPNLPTRPWGDAPATMWLVSPLSQQLVFLGYLYGRLELVFPGQSPTRVPVKHALLLTVCFFALWHVPNFLTLPLGYVVFQLFYTSVLAIIPGLTRQWTGSIWPAVLMHSGINFIAWATS